jgi:hypothetical protein
MTQPRMPVAERPQMPKGYGIKQTQDGLIEWKWIDEQMTQARNYWICSVAPGGKPHASPVWGVWVEGNLFFSCDRHSRKGRNLLANPAVTVHLESGDDTVIFEGVVEEVRDSAEMDKMAAAYGAKYAGMSTNAADYAGNPTFVLKPDKALAWIESDFPRTATRWRFTG